MSYLCVCVCVFKLIDSSVNKVLHFSDRIKEREREREERERKRARETKTPDVTEKLCKRMNLDFVAGKTNLQNQLENGKFRNFSAPFFGASTFILVLFEMQLVHATFKCGFCDSFFDGNS